MMLSLTLVYLSFVMQMIWLVKYMLANELNIINVYYGNIITKTIY